MPTNNNSPKNKVTVANPKAREVEALLLLLAVHAEDVESMQNPFSKVNRQRYKVLLN